MKKVHTISVSLILTLVFLVEGCSVIPGFILWNNTSSPMQIITQSKTIEINSHSKHKLPDQSAQAGNRQFDAVINWKGQRYGYVVTNPEALFKSNYGEGGVQHIWFSLQLQDDGKFYLVDPKRNNFEVLTNQPQGFPLKPVLISEAK